MTQNTTHPSSPDAVESTPAAGKKENDFAKLGLSGAVLRAVDDEGYHTATPIQAQAIPPVLAGDDIMGCAQTGTGKTAAFALPTLHRLMDGAPQPRDNTRGKGKGAKGGHHGPARKIRCLVLAPTRELAAQIRESFNVYGRHTGLRHSVIFGGVGQNPQVKALRAGVDILVATPGRLLDLMNQGHVNLSGVEVLILDEADQMLDMGFLPDLRRIIAAVPKKRQTLMFSATMPDEIRKLADRWLNKPKTVEVARVSSPAKRVEQSVYHVEKRLKPQLLAHYLTSTPRERTLVFARTKHGADKIVKMLSKSGLTAAAIHGNKSQNARTRALDAFKSNRPPVLVATDIAARGLDIDSVSHVINFELPETPEVYVHRIGRTGRAGAEGCAISFCSGDERPKLKAIERLTRRQIAVLDDHPEYKALPKIETGGGDNRPPRAPKKGAPDRRRSRNGAKAGAGKAGAGKRKRPAGAKSSGGGHSNSSAAGSQSASNTSRPKKASGSTTGAKVTDTPKPNTELRRQKRRSTAIGR
ncbi:ATP-dependent RNA helicase RhlE [Pseudobythopirellula maris]|uniref:DEAD-box ATP-dependent RNA helicase RhpA n=1 Tax=Pseudobythopirellula maris TaxID=2527991 RepID=A0A5C5ZMG2_9BACT|nr:DEAD/DEAH box helicase [Pseudobythopirellula maris]TWT88177.1 ATP-dependent RNA helicase RhlE [Pseudobythopirellula maris]